MMVTVDGRELTYAVLVSVLGCIPEMTFDIPIELWTWQIMKSFE
jgi:hypothetical protein